jgi:glyoxylase-like metal-dependent hydrolase (beta-lactamase superfamily II)
MPIYEIYALKYAGPFRGKLAMLRWNEDWDQDVERNYYIWAIKGKEGFTVVDTGTGTTVAAAKKLNGYVNPVDILERIGANGSNVTKVVITHIHFDHAGGMEMFPKAFPQAVFYVQKREFDFWTKSPIAKRTPFAAVSDELAIKTLASMEASDRLVLVDGDREIMPDMELLLAPGHTVGLQAVAVATAGGTAIVASDCAHVAKSFRDDLPSCFITDLVAWMKTYDKLRARASVNLIFPGHDALMFTNYPKVAEDITRLA